MPELDLSAPVFPGHAEKRARQAAGLETAVDRIIQVVEADGPDIAGLLLVRDAVMSTAPKRIRMQTWDDCVITMFCECNPGDELHRPQHLPLLRGTGLYGFKAVERRFRISENQAVFLFGAYEPSIGSNGEQIPPAKSTVELVARLESFIAAHSSPPFSGVTPRAYGAANALLDRDEMDHAENQPDKFDGGESVDTNWR